MSKTCPKCKGKGLVNQRNDGGRCFRCMGAGIILSPIERLDAALPRYEAHLAEIVERGTMVAARHPEGKEVTRLRENFRTVRAKMNAVKALQGSKVTMKALRAIDGVMFA